MRMATITIVRPKMHTRYKIQNLQIVTQNTVEIVSALVERQQ